MPLLDDFVERLDAIRGVVGNHPRMRIRTLEFRGDARQLVELWHSTRREIERWALHRRDDLDAVQKHTAWLLAATEESPETKQVRNVLREVATTTEERIVRPYRESTWWDYREGYDRLSDQERPLFDEALRCYGIGCFRAAIVMLWGAAAARLRAHVVQHMGLPEFNKRSRAVAQARHPPFSNLRRAYEADVPAELDLVPDAHILAVLLYKGPLDTTEYRALSECLELRHSCGHPGLYTPGKNKCLAQVDDILNVVIANQKFPA